MSTLFTTPECEYLVNNGGYANIIVNIEASLVQWKDWFINIAVFCDPTNKHKNICVTNFISELAKCRKNGLKKVEITKLNNLQNLDRNAKQFLEDIHYRHYDMFLCIVNEQLCTTEQNVISLLYEESKPCLLVRLLSSKLTNHNRIEVLHIDELIPIPLRFYPLICIIKSKLKSKKIETLVSTTRVHPNESFQRLHQRTWRIALYAAMKGIESSLDIKEPFKIGNLKILSDELTVYTSQFELDGISLARFVEDTGVKSTWLCKKVNEALPVIEGSHDNIIKNKLAYLTDQSNLNGLPNALKEAFKHHLSHIASITQSMDIAIATIISQKVLHEILCDFFKIASNIKNEIEKYLSQNVPKKVNTITETIV